MGQNDYVQTGVFLLCDRGTLPTPLIASPKRQNHHGTMGATIRDNIPLVNIMPFGVCLVTRMPCLPVMPQWQNYPKRPWFIEGAQPLLMKSYCRCGNGGTIRILPRLDFASIMASLEDLYKKASDLKDRALKIWDENVFPVVSEVLGAALLAPVSGILKITGNEDIYRGFGKGVLKGVGSTISGLVNTVIHPVETLSGLATIGGIAVVGYGQYMSVPGLLMPGPKGLQTPKERLAKFDKVFGTNLSETHEAIKTSVTDTFDEKVVKGSNEERAEVAGEVIVGIADLVFGGKGMGALTKGAKLSKLSKYASAASKASKAVKSVQAVQKITNATKGVFSKLVSKIKKWKNKIGKCDPVDVATGVVYYEGVDFEFPGPLPFSWERVWYSDSRWEGLLGHGVHSNWDMRLFFSEGEEGEGEGLTVLLPDGRTAIFERIVEGEQSFHRDEKLTLYHRGDGYEMFSHEDRLSYIFPLIEEADEKVSLVEVRNEAGHGIKLGYQSGSLHTIVDSAGRHYAVTTDQNKRVVKVELCVDALRRETLVEYEYGSEGDLTGITDAMGKTTRMAYENHLMVQKTDRTGHSFYWEYDGTTSEARCIHTWGDGGLLEGWFEYGDGYTVFTDSKGGKERYEYTDDKLITDEIDALGGHRERFYNLHGEETETIDADGRVLRHEYDEKTGDLLSVTYPGGGRSTFGYDTSGRLVRETTPGGATTRYEYNEHGLLCKVITPDGTEKEYLYNDRHLVSEIYDAGKWQARLSYDEQYNLIRAEYPEGLCSEWTYDHRGQVTSHRRGSGQAERYMYDALGRMTKTQLPDGNVVQLKYNEYDEVLVAEDATRYVTFGYTPLGSLKSRTENGRTIRFDYDTEDRLVSLRNEADEKYVFRRDAAGRIIEETGFDGATKRYDRHPGGAVRRVERPGGVCDEYAYDEAGRLCGITYADGTCEQYAYDADDRLVEARNADSTIRLVRDVMGRITEEQSEAGTVVSRYDSLGRRTEITSSLGAALKCGYTSAGDLQDMGMDGWQMHLRYNDLGLELSRSLTGGVSHANEYDGAGRITHTATHTGQGRTRSLRYRWETGDRLTAVLNEQTGKLTLFSYDERGFLTTAVYNTERLFRVPDAVGNLFRTSNRRDRKYGAGGRLLRSDEARYVYDEEGNLTEKHGLDGSRWHYAWNRNGSLREVVRPDGQPVTFTYDALGRRISKTFGGITTRWLWDGNTPLHEWREDVSAPPPDKNEITTWVFDEGTFRPAAKLVGDKAYSIITDYLGTPAEMYDAEGIKTWQAEFDIYGKIRTFAGRSLNDCPFRYQGQYEDSETGLYYNRFRYYSPDEGMYISQDPIGLAGGSKLYGYVHDSNTWVDESGLYGVKHDTPAWNARKNQQSSGYGKDNWRTGSLKKGEIVYGGVPGPSPYYMDKKTLDVSDGSREKLWKSLQVKPNPEKGYRPKVQTYRVKRDIKVGKGYALANPEYGKGGGRQFFIENYSEVLEPIGEPINLESDKNVILCK